MHHHSQSSGPLSMKVCSNALDEGKHLTYPINKDVMRSNLLARYHPFSSFGPYVQLCSACYIYPDICNVLVYSTSVVSHHC